MSMDNFQSDYDFTEKELNIIVVALDEIKEIKKKNPNEKCVSQDFKMKQASLKLKSQIQNLEVLANEYQNSGSRFNISAKDRQKRVEKIN